MLVKCIGSGLLQAAGVSALFSAGCWWGLSRVRGMTPVRKVLLTAGEPSCTAAQHITQTATAPAHCSIGLCVLTAVLHGTVNGATSAFVSLNWSMSSCHEAFLSHPTSAVAARTRTLVRSKLPDHPLLAPFTAEEDERLGRGELAMGSDDFLPPPPQRA